MKNAHNTSSALKVVRSSKSKNKALKVVTPATPSEMPSAVDTAAKTVALTKEEFLSARQSLRKDASILRSAAFLLQFAGMVGEALFLALGGVLYGFLLHGLGTSDFVAIFASVGVDIAGLVFGLVCVSFGTCLCGVAESIAAEIKKLMPTK